MASVAVEPHGQGRGTFHYSRLFTGDTDQGARRPERRQRACAL